jgi:hypothetical protein
VTKGVRLAGLERDRGGRDLTWAVADGERGRRWREIGVEAVLGNGASDGIGGLVRSLTLETGRGGQWLRLEVATGSGLLSLHPDKAGEIHGNVVSRDGVRHLALGVLNPALVEVSGSLAADAALCRALEHVVEVGEGTTVRVARVSDGLEVSIEPLSVLRKAFRSWELGDPADLRAIELDDHRVPVAGDVSTRWPLEDGIVTGSVD